jgi:hypothetical protein
MTVPSHIKFEDIGCTKTECAAAIVNKPCHPENNGLFSKEEIYKKAKVFYSEFYTAAKKGSLNSRLTQVHDEINKYHVYKQTTDEITFGAKTAW